MKNGDDDEDDEGMKETEKRDEEREEGRKKKETEGETERDRETPNTDASARSTLKITIGCLCRGPSRRKAFAQQLDSLVRVSRRVERDRKKKTRARELVIASGARNGRLWRARTPNICG